MSCRGLKGPAQSKCQANIGPARRVEARKGPEASASPADYGHLSAEKLCEDPNRSCKVFSLDLPGEQRLEKVQKQAPARRIMDIYRRNDQYRSDFPLDDCLCGAVHMWGCSYMESQDIISLFCLFYIESSQRLYYTYCISNQEFFSGETGLTE